MPFILREPYRNERQPRFFAGNNSRPVDETGYDKAHRIIATKYDVASSEIVDYDGTSIGTFEGLNGYSSLRDYILDGEGNREYVKDSIEEMGEPVLVDQAEYSKNEMNEYTVVDGERLVFDNDGNLLRDGSRLYRYDYGNRLVEIREESSGDLEVVFEYDVLGRRTAKVVYDHTGGVDQTLSTRYWSDGTEELEETSLAGTEVDPRRRYTYGTVIDEVCTMKTFGVEADTYYYHTNHQGTVYTITNEAGDFFERYEYDEYGNVRTTNGNPGYASAIGNSFLFQGRRYDPETNLYYYRARFYDPQKGRFITRDPKGYIDGLNMYAFVMNNPLNMLDPMGTDYGFDLLSRFAESLWCPCYASTTG